MVRSGVDPPMADPDESPAEEPPTAPPPHSWGNISEHHWSRARAGSNQEAIEHYRERSRAPGVASGGARRNHYCMSCNGVIPLQYDQREPASEELQYCPHCGVLLDARVRSMFNWVEIDQVPASDLRALLPFLLVGLAVLLALAWWFFS